MGSGGDFCCFKSLNFSVIGSPNVVHTKERILIVCWLKHLSFNPEQECLKALGFNSILLFPLPTACCQDWARS